jgi:enoyl-CoA hydratase/carnithine racemase
MNVAEADAAETLRRAGLAAEDAARWLAAAPAASGEFARDRDAFAQFWRLGDGLRARLPAKPGRSAAEAAAADLVLGRGREARERFLAAHAGTVYRALTGDRTVFVRVERLVYEAAGLVPGLAPSAADVARESGLAQRDKDGIEIDQGILLARILADPVAGAHLCHAMLLPRPEALARLPEFAASGAVDLGAATVTRTGKAAAVVLRNPRFLNAEDEATLDLQETAIDLAILDPASEIAVLRGAAVAHPKWRGRRVFSSGINLTHLYQGKISYLWYIRRDMGLVNKLYRGVARPDADPDEMSGGTVEKPWIAAVDGFAIGGGCQLLLVMDYVLAAADAYLTLPARKEGIIPGAANLRLARFTGGRIARQAILYGRRLACDSDAGRLVCDEIAAPDAMDAALAAVVAGFTSSGVVSAAGNRRALRMGEEPLDLFRRYMAVYAREQASCHFSPALIANLEHHWNAQQRRA